MPKNIKLHTPWLVWFGLILVLSLTPGDKLPKIKFEWFRIDTAVHVLMYLILTFLVFIGFYHQKNELSKASALYIIVSSILFGLCIEFLQGEFAFQRYFSWGDFIANTIGAIVGYFLYLIYKKKELNLVRFLQ